MRTLPWTLLGAATLLCACTTKASETPQAGSASSPSINEAAAVKEVQAIPSDAEAAAAAAQQINEKNADAEFDRLLQEIEADTGKGN